MSEVLYVTDAVVTGDQLRRLHGGQKQVCFAPRTVVTPTGWDYVRQAGLSVSRGLAPAAGSAVACVPEVPAPPPPAAAAADGLIAEVRPGQMVGEGRCDHPDRSCGCTTDEFGSGYVDGTLQGADLEALVQRITDLVMAELQGMRAGQ